MTRRYNVPTYTWPKDAIDLMLTLYSEGASASKIAAALGNGLTRNAVIGKLLRMRDKGLRPDRGSVQPNTKLRRQPPPRIKPTPVPPVAAPEPVGTHTATLANLRPQGCKWIANIFLLGEGDTALMCGELRFGDGPYCKRHYRMSKSPMPKWKIQARDRGLNRLGDQIK
jgi:GcrA cell cycle regulator